MNYLPIVGRELRVAARKRSTFWLRAGAAGTGLVIGGGCWILTSVRGAGASQMGSYLFYALTWMFFGAGLCAGLFLTSDCLSEEKREGTLGLLFLTSLRGYDVALGKLLATSLRGFYALLAIFPVVAITELMGGITGAQYWKSSLALANALFFSLAAGLLISALSRDSQKALAATFLVLLLLALGGPIADAVLAGVRKRGFHPFWCLSSPGYVLFAASAWGRSAYWAALVVTQLLSWAMLVLACAVVPHSWQERKRTGAGSSRSWVYSLKYGGPSRRNRLRRGLLERRPLAWLACRERWQALGMWMLALITLGILAEALCSKKLPQEAWIIWNYVGGLFTLVLYLWAGSQSCRFLVEARRSGLLELLLTAPVNERQIVRGQWRAFLRLFGFPVGLLLSVHVVASTLSQLSFQKMATQVNTAATMASTNQSGTVSNQAVTSSGSMTFTINTGSGNTVVTAGTGATVPPFRSGVALSAAAAAALSTAANLLAVCWFGMWMGMTSKSANLATLKTLLFVQVIPWLVIAFTSSMLMGMIMASLFATSSNPSTAWFTWWSLLSVVFSTLLALAKDTAFILWSRHRLYSSLREEAARSLGQPRSAAPPPLRDVVTPPVIPSAA